MPWHLRHCSIVTPLRAWERISPRIWGQVIVASALASSGVTSLTA